VIRCTIDGAAVHGKEKLEGRIRWKVGYSLSGGVT